tara:strand:- start:61 stop:576 length:516 start_codon:yes stop_codon:yes gene_type:complete
MFTHTNSPFKNSNLALCAGQRAVLSDLTQIVKKNFDLSEVQTALKPEEPDTNEVTKFFTEIVSMTPAARPEQFSTELWDKFPTSESEYEDIIKNEVSPLLNFNHDNSYYPSGTKRHCSFCGWEGHNIRTCKLKKWKHNVDAAQVLLGAFQGMESRKMVETVATKWALSQLG